MATTVQISRVWGRGIRSRANNLLVPRRTRLVDRPGARRPHRRRVVPRPPAVRADRRRPDPGRRPRLRARRPPGRADPHPDDQPPRRAPRVVLRRRGPRRLGPRGARGHLGLRRRRRPHRGRGGPAGRGGRRRRQGLGGREQRPGGTGPRADLRRLLGLRLRDRPLRGARRRQVGPAHRALRAAAWPPTASSTCRPPACSSRSRSTTPTPPAPAPGSSGCGSTPSSRR